MVQGQLPVFEKEAGREIKVYKNKIHIKQLDVVVFMLLIAVKKREDFDQKSTK